MVKKVPRLDDVITGCIKDDAQCKEWIYKTYYGYLISVIMRYLNDMDDSQEVVNDSFIKIFRKLYTFKFPDDNDVLQKIFKNWIAQIASRTAIDFLRAKKNSTSIDELPEEHQPVLYINALDELNFRDLLQLLDGLPEVQRLIFNMYEIEGFSHNEIARLLKIPENTSRVYLGRAKSKLKELYMKTSINSNGTY